MTQLVHILIGDSDDGSNHLVFYKGSQFTREQLIEAAEKDKYDTYQSGDGVQITSISFVDSVDLDYHTGFTFETTLPGDYT